MTYIKKLKGIIIVLVIGLLWAMMGVGIMYYGGFISFDATDEDAYATAVNNACKGYYSDIVSGETYCIDGDNAKPLFPELGEDKEKRREFAFEQTVSEALKYYSYYEKYSDKVTDCYITYNCDIVGKQYKEKYPDNINSDVKITLDTTLGELFEEYLNSTESSGEE
ncbi:MAG: hypothetical protein IJ192_14690 [Clostridia bacterium]|nr:hypothetical protein [Clostridia bacterium]